MKKARRFPWREGNQHPFFDLETWQDDVRNGCTVRGYDEWVESNLEQVEDQYKNGQLTADEYALMRRDAK
jgi:hypothetical protein